MPLVINPTLLLPDSVTETKIADGAITTDKIADNAITLGSGKIADGAIDTDLIADNAIDISKVIDILLTGKVIIYDGNDTVNRAIPHGLGRTPICQLFVVPGATWHGWHIVPGRLQTQDTGYVTFSVAAADDTNIYVGNASSYPVSANGIGKTYYCVVIG